MIVPSYPPPCGEGRRAKRGGVGVVRGSTERPPPPTPPHKGEGSRRAEFLVRLGGGERFVSEYQALKACSFRTETLAASAVGSRSRGERVGVRAYGRRGERNPSPGALRVPTERSSLLRLIQYQAAGFNRAARRRCACS